MSKAQDYIDRQTLKNTDEIMVHQQKLRVLELEAAVAIRDNALEAVDHARGARETEGKVTELLLEKAKVELDTQKIFKRHLLDAARAGKFPDLKGGGGISS